MDIQDLLKNSKIILSYKFEQRLNKLVRENFNFRNLDEANKRVILDLIEKYRAYLRRGIHVSSTAIRREMYNLYEKRLELGLTKQDLDDIREILETLCEQE